MNTRIRIASLLTLLLLALVSFFLTVEFPIDLPDALAAEESRSTPFPASASPDLLCLTWSEDPRTSQTIQWRTAPGVTEGVVQYRPKNDAPGQEKSVTADTLDLNDPILTNDPAARRFTATITGLAPATTYVYRAGHPASEAWTAWAEFTTAPEGKIPFSFVYMGDAQLGFEQWGLFLHQAFEKFPATAFYVLAGDLTNRGHNREDWDALFQAATGVWDRRPLVPAIGNHEYSRTDTPRLFLDMFTLPKNGPTGIPPEHTYSLRYGHALFLVLDSNQPPEPQRAWLDEQLASTDATWKFAVFHHPFYSSAPRRDNAEIRESWGPLFDKYHVDMVLQGHDHAYLRTPPMNAEKPVATAAEGTYYVVANSGSKHYDQDPRDYAAVAFTDVSTYQVIDIETSGGDKLTYRAYDAEGKIRDEIIIQK